MNSVKKKEFTARVTQATKSELVVIMYEIILTDIKTAREAYAKGDKLVYVAEMRNAQKFVLELMNALDFEYEISKQLMSLYIYLNKNIIKSLANYDEERLETIEMIVNKLLDSFRQVSEMDNSEPVMENTETLYAGLTYSRDSLNETAYANGVSNRGFMA